MEKEQEQKAKAQERDESSLKEAFETKEKAEANMAASAEEQFRMNMEILDKYVPAELLKRDPDLVNEMKLQVLQRYPTASNESGDYLSELLARDRQNELIDDNLKKKGFSEERIQNILDDKVRKDHVDRVLGPNSKVGHEAILKVRGVKPSKGEKLKNLKPSNQVINERDKMLLERSISESEEFIRYFSDLLESDPENEEYRDALKKFQVDRAKALDTLQEISQEKSKEDLFLNEEKGIKNTYGRREELVEKLKTNKLRYAQQKKRFMEETDPVKKLQIKEKCIRLKKLMISEQNSLLFERLYGETIDADAANAKDQKEIDSKIETYKIFQKRNELRNMSLSISKLRKKLENPNITKEERIEILKAIGMTEKSGLNNLELFGMSTDRAQNIAQRIGAISSEEYYELKKNHLMRMEDGVAKDVNLKVLEANKAVVDGFGKTISSLREKGFSNRDIQVLLDSLQVIRREKGIAYMQSQDDEAYTQLIESFLVGPGNMNKEGIAKAFVQEFTTQGMDKKDLRYMLYNSDELAAKAISEQREFAIKEKDRLGEVRTNREIRDSLKLTTRETRENELEQERRDIINSIKILGLDLEGKNSSDPELSEV